jgi:hypothetical protein
MKLFFRYTGGQLYNLDGDYGLETLEKTLSDWVDVIDYNSYPVSGRKVFWNVHNDTEKKEFEAAIALKCPELL